jgi:hypothetical protein
MSSRVSPKEVVYRYCTPSAPVSVGVAIEATPLRIDRSVLRY